MSNKATRSILSSILGFALFTLMVGVTFGQTGNGREGFRTDPRESRLSSVLRGALSVEVRPGLAEERIPVVVQLREGATTRMASTRIGLSGVPRDLPIVHGFSANLTRQEIADLASSDSVRFVSLDAAIRPTTRGYEAFEDSSPVSLTTMGADLAQADGFDGSGVVVALFDSGIGRHPDLEGPRILQAVDFTGGDVRYVQRNADGYGHGTAMAGIIGGSGRVSRGTLRGVAPNVRFVDLKVIDDEGSGKVSNLLDRKSVV